MAGFASKERSAPARRRRCGTWCGRPWKKPASSSTTRRHRRTERPAHLQHLKSNPVFRAAGSDCTLRAIDRLLGGQAWTRPSDWGAFFIVFPSGRPWNVPVERPARRRGLRGSARAAERPEGSCHVRRRRAARRRNVIISGSHRLVSRWFVEIRRGPWRKPRNCGSLYTGIRTCARCALPAIPRARRSIPRSRRGGGRRSAASVGNTGTAGDVILMHPLLLHAPPTTHLGSAPRFLINKDIQL